MGVARAFLGLGSNLGDRHVQLQRAVDELARRPGVRLTAISRVYETKPVGGPPQDEFLNAVVAIDTSLDPHALLQECHALEEIADRVRVERWGPRTLDVDLLLLGDTQLDTPDLTIPHPRMWERGFVLAPLRDVAPDLVAADATWEGVREAGVTLSLPSDA